jgi:hypothetical protein
MRKEELVRFRVTKEEMEELYNAIEQAVPKVLNTTRFGYGTIVRDYVMAGLHSGQLELFCKNRYKELKEQAAA